MNPPPTETTEICGLRNVRPAVRAMDGYVPGEQPRDARLIKLNTNENPYPPSPAAVNAAVNGASDRLNRYPDPTADVARDAAAALFGADRDWILAGNGSDDILTIAIRTFVDAGETIAAPWPTYSLYPILAEIQAALFRPVPLDADFSLPKDLADEAGDARLLCLARPNAPTGIAYPIEQVRALCAAFRGIVLIDEAYADFADDHCGHLVREFGNVILTRTLSKGYSLAAIRFGFAYAQPPLIAEMMKVKDSYNVNGVTQAIAAAALRDQPCLRAQVAKVRNTRHRVARELQALDFTVVPSQANFLFVRPPMPGDRFLAALRERSIIVRHFSPPETAAYVRVTIGTEQEMDAFLAATRDIC